MRLGLGVVVVVLLVACGSEADPAYSGAYPCSPACASDQVCVYEAPGVDGGAPTQGVCKPMGSCTSTPRCSCLGPLCPGWTTSTGECGVSSNGYVVVCGGA